MAPFLRYYRHAGRDESRPYELFYNGKITDPFMLSIAALSDIGLVRSKNEDAYWFDADRQIFILADGLGGHKAGEIAASVAVKIVADRLSLAVDSGFTDFELIDALQDAFGYASEEIYSQGKGSDKFAGMACSLIAGILKQEECYLAHAGDSRAYLYYDKTLSLMTVDDTPVAALIKRGYLLPEKARSHNLKNFLVKSVGNKPNVDANISRFPVKTGEKLVVCSDGLWGTLDHQTICDILQMSSSVGESCQTLVQAAREKGGQDNITVIIIEVAPSTQSNVNTVEMPRILLLRKPTGE
jgi:serine/threonine protein phosphatase PrpC